MSTQQTFNDGANNSAVVQIKPEGLDEIELGTSGHKENIDRDNLILNIGHQEALCEKPMLENVSQNANDVILSKNRMTSSFCERKDNVERQSAPAIKLTSNKRDKNCASSTASVLVNIAEGKPMVPWSYYNLVAKSHIHENANHPKTWKIFTKSAPPATKLANLKTVFSDKVPSSHSTTSSCYPETLQF